MTTESSAAQISRPVAGSAAAAEDATAPCVDVGPLAAPRRRVSSPGDALHPVTPHDSNWIPWRSHAVPSARIWVNEAAREISVVEEGQEHRIRSSDPTTFALDLADVESYYRAVPCVGTRDAAAILSDPCALAPPDAGTQRPPVSCTAHFATLVLHVHARGARLAATLLAHLSRPHSTSATEVAPVVVAPIIFGVLVFALVATNSYARSSWLAWAREFGSAELQRAIPDAAGLAELPPKLQTPEARLAAQRFEALLRTDVSLAITPPVAGAERCSGPVQFGTRIDLPGPGTLEQLAEIRVAVGAAAASFPRTAVIDVGGAVRCSTDAEASAGICVPISLRHGKFLVESCYLVASRDSTLLAK